MTKTVPCHPDLGLNPSSDTYHFYDLNAHHSSGKLSFSSVQFSSVCLTLCDRMDYSMPGLPIHHQFPEFTQTHVHWVSDAIQPSHPLVSTSPPTFNLSQHQGLFQWVTSSGQEANILEIWFPINVQDWFLLEWVGWISLLSKGEHYFALVSWFEHCLS